MRIVCLSSIIDDSFIEKNLFDEALSTADSNYNYRIVQGIDENNDSPCILLNYVPVGSYPHYGNILLHTKRWRKDKRDDSLNIGFINITGLKYISLAFNYSLKLKSILAHSSEKVYVICYDLYLPFLVIVNHLSKQYPNLISCLVVPAFPEHVMRHTLKERLKGRISKWLLKEAIRFRCFIFLTEYMKEKIRTENYTIVEGIIPEGYIVENIDKTAKDKNSEFTIAYTGRLDKLFQIDLLVEAVRNIKNYKVKLKLCGHGDLVPQIKRVCLSDIRIEYLGFLNKDDLADLQQNVDILINTRSPEDEYTKYSFPSKTMEYLASGTPVLMYKLPGIPEEYDKYLNYVNGPAAEDIQNSIEKLIEELINGRASNKARDAREYVAQFKNYKAQGKKVLDLLKKQ